MTIKITGVSTSTGEILLTITYDNPAGSGETATYTLRKQDLVDKLTQVWILLGRPLTITDARQALVSIINLVRQGKMGVPANFDFTQYIGVELEGS